MSTSKKPLGKRKRQSPPPSTTSQISRRLEKLRGGKRNLWNDDDEEEEEAVEQYAQSKNKPTTPIDNTFIVLTDSEGEKISSQRRSKSNKSKKKSSRNQDENLSSDNDAKITSKCPTCLICSILSTLTSYNCCPNHLSLLKYNKNSHHHHHHQQKQTTNSEQWPPQQVMVLPVTHEFIQRYLNPEEIYRLQTRTSTSPVYKKSIESKRSTRKSSKKSTISSELSDTEQSNVPKPKSSTKTIHMETDEISSSSSLIDSSFPNQGAIPPDATFTIVSSTSTGTSFESPTVLNTGQLQQSSDQPIVIDDSQPDNQQENSITKTTHEKKQNDPWTPISDETYAAIETALEQVNTKSQEQMEFTPALARRTPTDLMASRLPKIQLKKGRYHRGKPIADKNIPATTTNESHSINTSQSSSSSSTSVIITNTRPPSSLATIVEDESLVIQSTRQNSEKSSQSCQILSERHDNTTEGLSDTVMSCLFAQDESSQHDIIFITTKTIQNEAALPSLTTIIEECTHENENSKLVDISQSSQLTNDQNDTQPLISSTTSEKPTTPARISYRLNPDGSRISLSRPPLSSAHHQSPTTSSRRTSTDASHTNK